MKSLAEFEESVLHGPLEAVTPATFMAAQRRLDELQKAYFRRKDAYNEQWRIPRTERNRDRRGQFAPQSFAERSLPNGDKAAAHA